MSEKFTKMPNRKKFNVAMQKEFPLMKVVDRTESEAFCSLYDEKFNVADGRRTRINQHIKTRNTTKVQECRYEPPSSSEASMPQDSDVGY